MEISLFSKINELFADVMYNGLIAYEVCQLPPAYYSNKFNINVRGYRPLPTPYSDIKIGSFLPFAFQKEYCSPYFYFLIKIK